MPISFAKMVAGVLLAGEVLKQRFFQNVLSSRYSSTLMDSCASVLVPNWAAHLVLIYGPLAQVGISSASSRIRTRDKLFRADSDSIYCFERESNNGTTADTKPRPTVNAVISIMGVGLPSARSPYI